jgi:glucoamylase
VTVIPALHRRVVVAAPALLAATVLVAASDPTTREAPGAPGIGSAWTTGAKDGVGTSTTTSSKVWYTLSQGTLNEVYYPNAETPDVQDLQYMVTDGSTFTNIERNDTRHAVRLADPRSLTYEQTNTSTNHRYRITKTYVTDPDRPTLLVRTRFEVLSGGPLQLYVLFNPSLNNSGLGDTGESRDGMLVGSDGPVSSALASSVGFSAMTNGYSGTASDGYQDLMRNHRLTATYTATSAPGNLVQTAQVPVGTDTTFTLALGFGGSRGDAADNASVSLGQGWDAVSQSYQAGWHSYLDSLRDPPRSVVSYGLVDQYNVAVMVIKAHEDKTYRGAFVASLSVPWGEATNADHCCSAGYHAVWPRDLYQMATAEIAVGDVVAANRALDYLFDVQERPDGSYPQNTWLDGTPVFHSIQLDEIADPILLAWQLGRFDGAAYARIKPSAEYLAHHGPQTPQERWEEAGGYSPSTIAAEIAALVCAADIAGRNGDTQAQDFYLRTADSWRRQLDDWTFTTSGHLGGGDGYYERVDDNGNPNDGHQLCISNGAGCFDERDVVDPGFLELVRLGIRPADYPKVLSSLRVVDATIRVATPEGDMWHRYNHDGYGETADGQPYTGAGLGRLWPVLTGERGEYALAAGRPDAARDYLTTMAGSANAGFLVAEQVWDRPGDHGFAFGEGTGSATPLAWSMAQFVRLAVSIDAGHNVETPSVVAARYQHDG